MSSLNVVPHKCLTGRARIHQIKTSLAGFRSAMNNLQQIKKCVHHKLVSLPATRANNFMQDDIYAETYYTESCKTIPTNWCLVSTLGADSARHFKKKKSFSQNLNTFGFAYFCFLPQTRKDWSRLLMSKTLLWLAFCICVECTSLKKPLTSKKWTRVNH